VETHITQDQEIKSVPSAGKVILILLKYFQDHGQTVSSAWYCAVLEGKLKPTVHNKCRQMELFCNVTILNFIWQHHPLKQFGN
jgi:hypothetical protein